MKGPFRPLDLVLGRRRGERLRKEVSTSPLGRNCRSFPKDKYGKKHSLISKGVTAKVFLYRKEGSQSCIYAVKRFHPRESYEKRAVYLEAIQQEVDIHLKINSLHRGSVKLIDFFTINDENVYYVMEYLPYNLDRICTRYGYLVPKDVRLCYFKQLVEGVSFLQSRGISHRDIKPENCCIDRDGVLKIVDFGASIIGKHAVGLAGSRRYAAPEVFEGRKYDCFKSDMWSVGVCLVLLYYCSGCLWEIARPEENENFKRYLTNPCIENVLKVSNNVPSSQLFDHEQVNGIILRLLHIDAGQRYGAQEMIDTDWFRGIVDGHGCENPGHWTEHQKYLR
ncbi:DEKNAAC103955 [Brettanomyces naardenensis]|uniref:DEKNAAC103955 n=1 Tax=Brettanomyces naardenensis TaxID=13370 RepID=A0A448YPP2_BRENA|nr:DEKNAAC103955 [Brettanomyces naardenensis]